MDCKLLKFHDRVLLTITTVFGSLFVFRKLKIKIWTQDLYACSLGSSPAFVLPYYQALLEIPCGYENMGLILSCLH